MFRKLLTPGEYQSNINIALFVLRLAAGLFMLSHGLQKMSLLFSGEPIQFADPIGIGQEATLALAVFTEVLCALFLIIGLGTRVAAILLLVTMAIDVFIVHAGDEFKAIELPLLYLSTYLSIIITGAGKYSIDNLLFARIK